MLRAYFIIALLFSALAVAVLFDSVHAQPSIPEFTVKYIDLSYDVPPTYGIDEFTGETVITQEGYHMDNQSAVFKIKSQPFNPYTDSGGNNISLYYNFRAKGHFGGEWRYYPFSDSGISSHRYSAMFYSFGEIPEFVASTSEYTALSVSLTAFYSSENLQIGNQIDFQVQAQIGYIDYSGDGLYSFLGETSDWSETQAITIGESQTPTPSPVITPTPTPYQDPQQTEQETIIGTAITVAVIGAGLGLLIYLIKRK
jgi:hypothetical protein